MSSFGGNASFKVRVQNDGFWPSPEIDAEGVVRYKAEIAVFGYTAWSRLLARQSVGTLKRQNGAKFYNWHANNGVGAYQLVVPSSRGVAKTYTKAVLTSISGGGSAHWAGTPVFFGNVEFIILSTIEAE
jgi:hypothetical protein